MQLTVSQQLTTIDRMARITDNVLFLGKKNIHKLNLYY